MKRAFTFMVIMFVALTANAEQQPKLLWPISNAKQGSNILSAPQSYIAGELNFDNLFIGAAKGTVVLAPADGTILSISLCHMQSLTYSLSYNFDKTFDNSAAILQKNGVDIESISGSLGINIGSGQMLYIRGLTGDIGFKTGQKIKRGDTLGYVDYSYAKIKEPSISVAISQNTKSSDPMSGFGIKSTFIVPADIKEITSLTTSQAIEDFNIYINALKEVYPGLYNLVTPYELDRYVDSTVAHIKTFSTTIPFFDFGMMVRNAVALIHDSHIYLNPMIWEKKRYPDFQSPIYIGFIGDTMLCTNATKEYEYLYGKRVLSVNGIDADSARRIIASKTLGYDAQVESYIDYRLATVGFGTLFHPQSNGDDPTFDMMLKLDDGQSVFVKGLSTKNGLPKYINNWINFMRINYHKDMFSCVMLNDSTAYIGLTTFQLSEVQLENIGKFIDSISQKAIPNLIVDVRNNGGGDVERLEKLYSYMAGDAFTLNNYSKVNKKGNFEHLKYSMNYTSETEIFPNFVAKDGIDGFYEWNDKGTVVAPDSLINYKGRLYVLTNENSISAATSFPSMVVRNHRGLVVGRETRTAYHFMNALKFADIRLPSSMITITIPLVGIYFDTIINSRVPYGRGLIPDCIVPLTLDELNYTNGDAILNHAIRLIEQNRYINTVNPFSDAMQKWGNRNRRTAEVSPPCVRSASK